MVAMGLQVKAGMVLVAAKVVMDLQVKAGMVLVAVKVAMDLQVKAGMVLVAAKVVLVAATVVLVEDMEAGIKTIMDMEVVMEVVMAVATVEVLEEDIVDCKGPCYYHLRSGLVF